LLITPGGGNEELRLQIVADSTVAEAERERSLQIVADSRRTLFNNNVPNQARELCKHK